jgi:hypothetical protein
MAEETVAIVTAGKANLIMPPRVVLMGALVLRGSTRKHGRGA